MPLVVGIRCCRLLAALLVILGAGSGCAITDPSHPVVRAYLAAEVVAPTWNSNIHPSEPGWSTTLDIPSGVTVTLTARCCVGGRFRAKYSDELESRNVGNPGDYVYPLEMRMDRKTLHAFGMASGLAGGVSEKTVIFQYDLTRRQAIGQVEVSRKILPEPRKPDGPRPPG
jgi:hypothetical protein